MVLRGNIWSSSSCVGPTRATDDGGAVEYHLNSFQSITCRHLNSIELVFENSGWSLAAFECGLHCEGWNSLRATQPSTLRNSSRALSQNSECRLCGFRKFGSTAQSRVSERRTTRHHNERENTRWELGWHSRPSQAKLAKSSECQVSQSVKSINQSVSQSVRESVRCLFVAALLSISAPSITIISRT